MLPIVIIGAGAAGLFCAAKLGMAGIPVHVIDKGKRPGRKILISGGGKCNFTNLHPSAANYLSQNLHFCKSALSRFTPADFIALVDQFHIRWQEREQGRLFCEGSAKEIVHMLMTLCQRGNVRFHWQTEVQQVTTVANGFTITASNQSWSAERLIIATGGLSLPALGTSTIGYQIATQFGIEVVPLRAGLVPLTLTLPILDRVKQLAGISIYAEAEAANGMRFRDHLLFTHRGISGPVILQISNYWHTGESLKINLCAAKDSFAFLQVQRHSKKMLKNVLSQVLPKRLVEALICWYGWPNTSMREIAAQELDAIFYQLSHWYVCPKGTEGYSTAEVTLGGISVNALSSKTLGAISLPNLYFIGEVVDVTGWLGGYNLHWAWSSATACAEAIIAQIKKVTK